MANVQIWTARFSKPMNAIGINIVKPFIKLARILLKYNTVFQHVNIDNVM